MTKDQFIIELEKINIVLSNEQLDKLDQFYKLLKETNEKINLTNIILYDQVYLKHFYDSLSLVRVVDLNKISVLGDVGCGAGFPGIVLKIAFPHIKLILIESITKKTDFLKEVIVKLNLTNVEIINERAEEYASKYREQMDIITARAVANINILMEYCLPLLKVNGHFIAMKGQEEVISKTALDKLKAKLIKTDHFELPQNGGVRTLYHIEKTAPTPTIFPRKYSEITKRTL